MLKEIILILLFSSHVTQVQAAKSRDNSRNRTKIERRGKNPKKEKIKILVLLPENENFLFRQFGYSCLFLKNLKISVFQEK